MAKILNWILTGFSCVLIFKDGLCNQQDGLSALQRQCRDGTFGYKCMFRCRCARNRVCDKETGECPNGCDDGYWGPGCQLANSCFYNGKARNYMGTKSVTKQLYICQRWDSQEPHRHSYNVREFPDETMPENYCRTTTDSARPWCYTTSKQLRWEHCDTNNCNCPPGRFGNNCLKECHCADLGESCDSILGICSTGCAQGWDGYDCQTAVSCPANRYSWDCSKACYCTNPLHCNRFTGPTKDCQCMEGYFNAPFCQPVTPPKIMVFDNIKVNPGQPATFNCTVSAFPIPLQTEIELYGPTKRHISLLRSTPGENSQDIRINIFRVEYVNSEERYSCVVRATAGEASRTVIANVYELPRLVHSPTLTDTGIGVSEMSVQWNPWARERGDKGDPPILWYNIWVQKVGERSDKMVGIVTYFNCSSVCKYTITDLEANTEYGVRIATRRNGKGGDGPLGPALFAKTGCTAPNEAPVIDSLRSEFEYNSSYPQTQLIVFWKDAPNATWNCNNISAYHIHLTNTKQPSDAKAIHLPGDTLGDGSGMKSVSISDLKPSTRYCVRINFQNDVLLFSPNSLSKCIDTPDTKIFDNESNPLTPSFPRNFMLRKRTNTSLIVSWDVPDPLEDVDKYHLVYWKGYWPELATKRAVEIMATAPHMEYIIDNLEPYTKYHIQVQGINSAGPGEQSEPLSVMTDESVPGKILKFRNTSKTDSSIILEWGDPESINGELLFFTVTCNPVESLLAGQKDIFMTTVSPKSRVHTFHDLSAATKYVCSVNASTGKGSGPSSVLEVWTLAPDQLDLPTPQIKEKSESTVTLQLDSLDDQVVSYYRIIVERLDYIAKRSIPDSIRDVQIDFQTAMERRSRTYVAAQIDRNYTENQFVVGDNKTYDGYYNAPLSSRHQYEIWVGAYSIVDGNTRKSFAKAERSVVARSVAEAPENSHIPVIIGVLVVFIMLILVFALLLFIWRRRHLASEREKSDMQNFGPTIIPEPDTSLPSTPIDSNSILHAHWNRIFHNLYDDLEIEPLIETCVNENENEPIYGNVGVCIIPPVRVEDLWDYVKLNKENSMEGLRKEYRLIPAGLTANSEVAKKCENKSKNRYGNIIAYDHTRVILEPVNGDIHDDYTNANYIDGYKKPKAFIAAQGPTKPTINDIWRMVWKEDSKTIIMLTNPTETGKKKCEQYWPDEGKVVYAGITVELVDTDNLPDFSVRTFHLSKGEESKSVKQFHYTTWPDHGVPRFGNSLLLLRQKIRTYDNLESGPPIVHCSAGVGRTGTYIAIDVNLEQAKNEGLIDVHNFVQLMRTQRVNMVQTLEQYIFVYDVLLEALICGDTTVPADRYPDTLSELMQIDQNIGKTKLEEQFEVLRLISATIEKDDTSSGLRPENMFKNRCKNIIPANRCRPYLMTPVEEYNDYINAVFLNGYRRKDAFIVTQSPLPNTVVDFWRLVYDHNSYCIVMLNELSNKDETCEIYWTLDTCGERYGPFIVETTAEIKSDPSFTVRDFTITNTLNPQEVPRVVRQFEFHRWPESSNVPSSKVAMLELIDMVDRTQKQSQNKPVIVHCMNGASRSGLFIASSCVLERIRADKEVDVFQAVKQMRLNRSQHIDNIEQFRFCHEIALEYLNSVTMTTFS